MRRRPTTKRAALTALASLRISACLSLCATNAIAQSAVLTSPPGSAELREARVAVSKSPSQSTLWFSATIHGAADHVYVVVPAAPGSSIDSSSDAFFESLADATHRRILPPEVKPDVTCPSAVLPESNAYEIDGDISHIASVAPSPSSEVFSLTQLLVWLSGQQLSISFETLSQYADLVGAGYQFVVVHYEVPPGQATLGTIRVASTVTSNIVPLVATSAGAAFVRLHVWTFAQARANPGVLPVASFEPEKLRWSIDGNTPASNYHHVMEDIFDSNPSWIVDAASRSAMYRSASLLGGAASIPSVVEGYFDRAAGYGDTNSDVVSCIAKVAALETNDAQVGDVCAPGTLAVVPGDACAESAQPGKISPDDLRCGGIADDIALAMTGLIPSQLWLTRWTGVLAPWTALAQEKAVLHGDESVSSSVTCGHWDTSICNGSGGSGGDGGSNGDNGVAGSNRPGGTFPPGSGNGSYSPPNNPYNDNPYKDDDDEYTEIHIEGSCWGDSSTTTRDSNNDDSCSGDSSDSSNGDSCSGDSSDSSDGDSCSGDSSDSSDGDSCSGDSSDSSDGDSCSGDSSDSSDGDSCSGGSSDGDSSEDCSLSRGRSPRRRRLPTSAFALLIAASTLTARRLRRADERRVPFR